MRIAKYFAALPLLAAASLALFAACGNEGSGVTAKNSSEDSQDATDKTAEDLPNCTENREGMEISTAEGLSFVCEDGEWKDAGTDIPSYKTEEDLPNCTENREGARARIKGTSETYVCKDDEWIEEGADTTSKETLEEDDGEESSKDKESSASKNSGKSSSSKVTPGSSEATTSSPSAAPASSATATDTTAPDGSCAPNANAVQKGGFITWTFTPATLNTTNVNDITNYRDFVNGSTCNWTIQGGDPGTASGECGTTGKTITATYGSIGNYKASIKLGEKNINCGTVKVNGLPIKGCSCKSNGNVDIATDPNGKWTASCTGTGNDPITGYKWEGATGSGATATYKFTAARQKVSPKVTISTAEADTVITCPSPMVSNSSDPEYVLYVDNNISSSHGVEIENEGCIAVIGTWTNKDYSPVVKLQCNGRSVTITYNGHSWTNPEGYVDYVVTSPIIQMKFADTETIFAENICVMGNATCSLSI